MKKRKLLSVLVAAALGCSLFAAVPVVSQAADTTGVNMYRIYNPNSGEHFYTKDASEKDGLVTIGWKDEGIGWIAPEKSNTPVYRLYNPNSGDHHYTMNKNERDSLIVAGWNDEGIGWYSDDNKTVPLYREYNPNAVTGTHNYTADKAEHDSLVKAGWKDENIGWYAIGDGVKIGDIVILGTYEQDNDLSNGPEPIEWQVIGTRDGHLFLLSKYALDHKVYNEKSTDITWENCTLRSWLNNDFYNTAFSASDKTRIVTAHNENPDTTGPNYAIPPNPPVFKIIEGGNATDDKVFLLSSTEARDYLDGKTYTGSDELLLGYEYYNQKILCRPTAYAKAHGVRTYDNSDNKYPSDTAECCRWWLRSPGPYQNYAINASYHGFWAEDVHNGIPWGDYSLWWPIGVRPAILIN